MNIYLCRSVDYSLMEKMPACAQYKWVQNKNKTLSEDHEFLLDTHKCPLHIDDISEQQQLRQQQRENRRQLQRKNRSRKHLAACQQSKCQKSSQSKIPHSSSFYLWRSQQARGWGCRDSCRHCFVYKFAS